MLIGHRNKQTTLKMQSYPGDNYHTRGRPFHGNTNYRDIVAAPSSDQYEMARNRFSLTADHLKDQEDSQNVDPEIIIIEERSIK